MDSRRAVRLLEEAVGVQGGVWADLGCGEGTFTLALAELLGRDARIYAVDADARALSRLRRRAAGHDAIIPVLGDFTGRLTLPGYDGLLDGLLFANTLHYVERPEEVLAALVSRLGPGGRVVVVEYDRRSANSWVPYPIPPARLETVALRAGLSPPMITATQPSAFSGNLYVAVVMGRQPIPAPPN